MKTKSTIIKYWNGKRYHLSHGRWERQTKEGHIPLANDVWNYYHLEDLIVLGNGFVIHHINKNPLDNRIENLQKMGDSEHKKMHSMGINNPAFKDGRTLSKKKYVSEYKKKYFVEKCLFSQSDKENHFQYQDFILINKHTKSIKISNHWRYY